MTTSIVTSAHAAVQSFVQLFVKISKLVTRTGKMAETWKETIFGLGNSNCGSGTAKVPLLSRGEYNVKNLKLYPDGPDAMGKLFPNLRGAEGAELAKILDFYPKLPKIPHSTAMKVQKLFPQGPKFETLPGCLSGPTPKYSPLV